MKTKVQVVLEYWAHFTTANSEDYRISRIAGLPFIEVEDGSCYEKAHVGDIITESQAIELAKRVSVTTVMKPVK